MLPGLYPQDLEKKGPCAPLAKRGDDAVPFVCHSWSITGPLSFRERCKLHGIGLFELLPLIGGVVGADCVESDLLKSGVLAGSVGICVWLCWVLRRYTPMTRIYHSAGGRENKERGQ